MIAPAITARRSLTGSPAQTCLLGGIAIAAAVWVASVGSQSQHAFTHEAAPVLLAPFALWLFFSERYDVTLAILLLYLGLLDGFVKLASGSNIATLGRDVLLYSIVLGAVLRVVIRKTPLAVPPLTGFVLAWVAVCVVQVANPSGITLTHSLASLRQHLEFVPLFFLGYAVLRSERRLVGLLVLLLVVGSANGIVNLVQSQMAPAQLAKWGPGYAGLELGTSTRVARVFVTATYQLKVRPPGLGGTDGFGGFVALMALPAAIALLSSVRRGLKLGAFLLPATLFIIVGVVTSQTRLDIVGSVIALTAFLSLTLTSRRGAIGLVLILFVGLAGFVAVSQFASHNANRYSTIAPSQVVGTAVSARQGTLALVPKYLAAYPLGAGLGSVGPAGGSTIGGNAAAKRLNGESEITFLLVEAGIPGLLAMLALTIATVRTGIRLRLVADPTLQRCLMALTAVLIAFFAAWFIGPITSDSPASPFFWLTSGALAYWYGEVRAGRVNMRPRRVRASLARR